MFPGIRAVEAGAAGLRRHPHVRLRRQRLRLRRHQQAAHHPGSAGARLHVPTDPRDWRPLARRSSVTWDAGGFARMP